MRQIKLGTKLLTGGLLVLVIPVIIIGVVSVYESSRSISGMGKADMANIAESLAAALDIGMNEQIVTVRNISYSSSVITAAEKVMAAGEKSSQDEVLLAQKELTKIKTAEGDRISSLVLTGRNGIVYASSDNGNFNKLDLSGRDYLDKAFKGTPNIGSVVISRATGRVVCTAACPIYDSKGKEITGSVVMVMELKFFSDILDRI
ncbi:MAG: cache domain-containing protein, partial [Desulfoplanes sp.]